MLIKHIKIGEKSYEVSSDDDYLQSMGDEFEPNMVQLFYALIIPSDVIADIGANIGMTAILFSYMAKKVYAFEASPTTYQVLVDNLGRNSIANVVAVNLGLGHRLQTLKLMMARNNRSGGFVSTKIQPQGGHVTEEIKIDTLDRYFSDVKTLPTFMKIDVEGYEKFVIEGGRKLLETARPTVVLELNHFCLDVLQRITIPDFLDFMRSVFPYLYAVDFDNRVIIDIHLPDLAYMVMHEHVVKHRFPNLVGGFDPAIKSKLDALAESASSLWERYAVTDGRGVVEIRDPLPSLRVGETVKVPVIIFNNSSQHWMWHGSIPINLSYHWLNKPGQVVVFDGERTPLPKEGIAPGEHVTVALTVKAPEKPGRYRLQVMPVQESHLWLDEVGFVPTDWSVEVR